MKEGLVKRLHDTSLLVVGDIMLDEYLFGTVVRISPEAPVPVVELVERQSRLGGAANVAANAAALDGRVRLGGVVGNDGWGDEVETLVASCRGLSAHLVRSEERGTNVKTRVVAGGQHIVRVDREIRRFVPAPVESHLLSWIEEQISDGIDACVLSDYAKGALTTTLLEATITRCVRAGIPVIVDPKGRDFGRYRGATVITPNLTEIWQSDQARAASSLTEVAARVRTAIGGGHVVVTRGPEGLSLFREGADRLDLQARATTVFDRTGAGDTLTAVLALALGAGVEMPAAVWLANHAAGVVVGKVGTSVVTATELTQWLTEAPEAEWGLLDGGHVGS